NNEGATFSDSKGIYYDDVVNLKYRPKVASYDNNIHVLFRGETVNYVISSNDGGATFKTPISLSSVIWPEIDTDQNGNVYIAYTQNPGGINLIRSSDNGTSFSDPITVDLGGFAAGFHSMDIDTEGNIYITWVNVSSGFFYFSKSTDNGISFSTPIKLSEDPRFGPFIDMCVDEWNGVYIVWYGRINDDYDILFSYSDDGGTTFSSPVKVNDDRGISYQKDPVICTDDIGNLHLAWMDERDGNTSIYYTNAKARNHPPIAQGVFPGSISFDEDLSSGLPLLNLTLYWKDDLGYGNLRYNIYDNINTSFFESVVLDGYLNFNQIKENVYGTFGFNIEVFDNGFDGVAGTSDDLGTDSIYFELIVNPQNDPPVITGIGDVDVVDGEISISVHEDNWFNSTIEYIEVDGEACTIFIQGDYPNLKIENDTIQFLPTNDDVGVINITLVVQDQNGTIDTVNISFIISNTNDPPEIVSEKTLNTIEDVPIMNVDIENWFFDIDNDQLTYSLKPETILEIHLNPNNTMDIIPDLNWYGRRYIEIGASDGEITIWLTVEINVDSVNDHPSGLNTTYYQDRFIEGKEQLVRGTATDVEDGDALIYEWFEGSISLGKGDEIDLGLGAGVHVIIMRVSDFEGQYSEITFTIEVDEPEEQNNDRNFMFLLIIALIILVLIIITVAVFLVIRSMKKGKEKTQPPQKDIPEVADIPVEEPISEEVSPPPMEDGAIPEDPFVEPQEDPLTTLQENPFDNYDLPQDQTKQMVEPPAEIETEPIEEVPQEENTEPLPEPLHESDPLPDPIS
ncbi:MAG: hypothetical protein KAH57_03415, partial [Thermoplasmata archaeon]|nr:hypothetical protein [Thermoplasmata archaeon]